MRRAYVIAAVGIAAAVPLAAIVIVGINDSVESNVFQQEILKTSLQLVLVGVLGMLAREVYLSYSAQQADDKRKAEEARQKQTQEHSDRVSALNQLTQGYWGVKKCLHIIHGHRSALSYKEQMHLIIDYRLQLQKLDNEIIAGMYSLSDRQKIGDALNKLDEQLEELVKEWTDNYLPLSWQQADDEEVAKEKKKVPSMIENLPALSSLWDNIKLIHEPFEEAANLIRAQLRSGEKHLEDDAHA